MPPKVVIGRVVRITRTELYNAPSALLGSVYIVERLCKSREMDRQAHSHEDVEHLMRMTPYIESPGFPLLRDTRLEFMVHC